VFSIPELRSATSDYYASATPGKSIRYLWLKNLSKMGSRSLIYEMKEEAVSNRCPEEPINHPVESGIAFESGYSIYLLH
jgi:hypothetical protein